MTSPEISAEQEVSKEALGEQIGAWMRIVFDATGDLTEIREYQEETGGTGYRAEVDLSISGTSTVMDNKLVGFWSDRSDAITDGVVSFHTPSGENATEGEYEVTATLFQGKLKLDSFSVVKKASGSREEEGIDAADIPEMLQLLYSDCVRYSAKIAASVLNGERKRSAPMADRVEQSLKVLEVARRLHEAGVVKIDQDFIQNMTQDQ